MRDRNHQLITLILQFAVLALLGFGTLGCDTDKGLTPLESKVSGKITYLLPEFRPDNVGEVRIAALLNFPPSGLGDVFFSEPLDFKEDTARYELALPPAEYASVVLLWRQKGESWSFNSLLGLYGYFPPFQLELLPVDIVDDNTHVQDIDVYALWNFAAADARINGRINFEGTLPSDTEALLVAAFNAPPNFDDFAGSLLLIGGIPLPVSGNRPSTSYELRVFRNDYKLIGLFWKGFSTPLEEMKLIGYYRNPNDITLPGEVTVEEGQNLGGIDFSADFGSLPDGIRP